jgi:hypothetical protein
MKRQGIVERLLKAVMATQWNMSSAFGGAAGVGGSFHVLQADMNRAIERWLHENDASGIRQITGTLHVTGGLTDKEYEQIMKEIDGAE